MSRFQVIIPVLNAEKTLRHTLQTLADLPNDNVSFLISNNSSTDSTPEILEDFDELTEEDIRAALAFAADREKGTMIIPSAA